LARGNALLYRFLSLFLKVVTSIFFRKVEVVGTEHIPEDEPVIFIGNHPNSLMDPVMIIATCGRKSHFAAKDVLFEAPGLRWVLRALGAVPIARAKDHPGKILDNTTAFSALVETLVDGGAMGIFPEGISYTASELQPLKTGAARIAMQAVRSGAKRVNVVPCGLTYHRRERMRGRVLVQYGAPLVVDADLLKEGGPEDREAVRRLTDQMETLLRALTINAPDFETLRVLDGVRRLYRPAGMKLTMAERAELSRRFLDHWERLKDEPDVAELYRDMEVYLDQLDALGLSDRDLRQALSKRRWAFHVARHLILMLVFIPLAMPGILIHTPVLIAAVFAGDGLTRRKDVRATTKMMTITVLIVPTYALMATSAGLGAGVRGLWVGLWTACLLPASGWATIRVLERQAAMRRGISVFLSLVGLRAQLARLQEAREALRQRLLTMVDTYLDPELERVIPQS
jgi:1-acyl-sn-glycerol-3-phosphate acyltransferase